MLEYKIVQKAQFTVVGTVRKFNTKTSQTLIPKFWQEIMSKDTKELWGMYGICLDDTPDFRYMIADDYAPWKELSGGFETQVIPAGMWAVFPCKGVLPQSIQELTKRIYTQWLPLHKEYKKSGAVEIEYYTQAEDYCEIWVPVKIVL